MSRKTVGTLLILLAAVIWGFGFVVQSSGINDLGPFLFSGVRMLLATAVLLPLYIVNERRSVAALTEETRIATEKDRKERFWLAVKVGGFFGLMTTAGNAMQLTALAHMSAGKNAFLICMYVAMVPFITLAMGEKSPLTVWLGVVLALVGMFLLCIKGDSLAFAWADWLAIASSAFSAE